VTPDKIVIGFDAPKDCSGQVNPFNSVKQFILYLPLLLHIDLEFCNQAVRVSLSKSTLKYNEFDSTFHHA
jgi:hypothetical protein